MPSTTAGNAAWFTSAAVVATCALAFTVASFWWLNARRGRLESFAPHTFAAAMNGPTRIRLPLVFYNSGAVPIIVQNLRLRLPGSDVIPWIVTRSQLKPASNDNHQFAAVFCVAGRSVQQLFVEFGGESAVECVDQIARLEVKLGHKKRWVPLLDFTLHASRVSEPGVYITYGNDPDA